MCVKVPEGGPGTTIKVPHPKAPDQFIDVHFPEAVHVGQPLLVPVPRVATTPTEPLAAIVAEESQRLLEPMGKSPNKEKPKYRWSTGAKVAVNTTAVLGVGGLAAGGAVVSMMVVEDGWDATAEEFEELAILAGDGIVDGGETALDWLGGSADDVGGFIMDLF